ncbi:hypothetical protein HDV04_001443 [Boothiomyces sp. JEL0838]|nr:hypothetical protein HDV04_001443 [Boothiomyces sp. JEL0838]
MSLKKRISYTAADKLRIIHHALAYSQAEASRKFDVHKSMVSRWVHQYSKIRKAEPESKRIGAGKKCKSRKKKQRKIQDEESDESEIDMELFDNTTDEEGAFNDNESDTTLVSNSSDCADENHAVLSNMKDLYLLSFVATEYVKPLPEYLQPYNSKTEHHIEEDNLDIGNDDIPEKNAEKRLDHALGIDEGAAKKGKNGKNISTPTKKPVPGKGKGKQKGGKGTSKKQTINQDVLDDKSVVLQTDVINEAKEDENAGKNGSNKKGDEPYLSLLEEEEAGWESDLDVSEIINRKSEKEPYLAACAAFGLVPVSYIADRLEANEIIMPYHGLGPLRAIAFSKQNSFVTHLDLSNNSIEHGGKALALSLSSNHKISYLNLANNSLRGCGPEIAAMMSDNSTIKTLILSGNEFGDKEATFIAEGLRQNQFLQVLDISRNDIGDIGGIALGNGLVHNEGLKELNVSWNQIRIRGITGFLNGAKDNSTLNKLDLSHNGIGDNGNCLVTYLAKTSIKSLNLGYTRMDDTSFAQFWKAVESNRSLNELDVSGNNFSNISMMTMLKGLTSTKIVNLVVKNIRFEKETLSYIETFKKESSTQKIVD